MRRLNTAAVSLAVVFVLVVTAVPVQSSDVSAESDGDWTEEETTTKLIKNADGTYHLSLPFLEDMFGLGARDVYPGDPAYGLMGHVNPEVHAFDGNSGNSEMYIGSAGDYRKSPSDAYMTHGIAQGIEFGAKFTDRSVETDVEDIFTYGINVNSALFIQCCTTEEMIRYDGSHSNYMHNLLENTEDWEAANALDYRHLNMMQGCNYLKYAVGNFTEDESEEFALYMGNTVDIYDCVDGMMKVVKQYVIPEDPWGWGCLIKPVSMCCGDTDKDGIDEIVMTVEYAADHSSPSNCTFSEHQTIIFLMKDGQLSSSRIQFQADGNTLKPIPGVDMSRLKGGLMDTVMTSVVMTDFDRDQECEVVIGGYLWHNDMRYSDVTMHDQCMSSEYLTGEIFMATLEPDTIGANGAVTPKNISMFRDDDNQSATNGPNRYTRADGDTLNGHYLGDTSIYLDDNDDNAFGYCRGNNWCNWTLPMETLMLKGTPDTSYVYLDYCIYKIDPYGNISYAYEVPLKGLQDNNNVACVTVQSGSLVDREGMECIIYDDLYRFVAMDRQKNDGTNVYWTHDITYYNADSDSVSYVMLDDLTVSYDWNRSSEPPHGCLADTDPSDLTDIEFLGTVSSFLDPVVVAAISAVPYDDDLASILRYGSDDIGSTAYVKSEGSGSGKGNSMQLEFGLCTAVDTWVVQFDAEAGPLYEKNTSNTQTVTFETEYKASMDSVAMYLTPFACYCYRVSTYEDGVKVSEQQNAYEWQTPLDLILPYNEYRNLIEQYNKSMAVYAEKTDNTFYPVPIIEKFNHTEGDITSYYGYTPADPLIVNNEDSLISVNYSGYAEGSHFSTTKSMELTNMEETSDGWGGQGNMQILGGLISYYGGLSFNGQGSFVDIKTDMSGMTFKSEFSTGMSANYMGEPGEAKDVLSHYGMTGKFWAEDKTLSSRDANGNVTSSSPYVCVGYTVENHSSPCKLGALIVNTFNPDGSDRDDPYNPTRDSICMEVVLPSGVRDDRQIADAYELQIEYDSNWNGISEAVDLGLHCLRLGEDGEWIETDDPDKFIPDNNETKEFMVKITGLMKLHRDSYNFRLVGYQLDQFGERDNVNPSLPVEGQRDTRLYTQLAEKFDDFIVSDGDIYIPADLKFGHRSILFLKTELEPGTHTAVYIGEPSDCTLQSELKSVAKDGIVFMDMEATPREPVPSAITLLLGIGLAAALIAGMFVLRRA